MVKRVVFSSYFFVLVLFSVTPAYSMDTDVVSVHGSSSPVTTQSEVVEQRLVSTAGATDFPLLTLEPVASVKLQALAKQDSIPKQIGFSRNVVSLSTAENTDRQLSWHKLTGKGHYTGIGVSSPQARALRVGMMVDKMPESAEVRFFGLQEGAVVDVHLVTAQKILDILRVNREADPADPNGKVFWSPTISGDNIGIEIYLPENPDPSSVQVAFPLVSHISMLPFSSNEDEYTVQGYGDSDTCQNDATCAVSWSKLSDSVAGMQFSTIYGTYICTGSLLNDDDTTTSIPYFISANHCISTQSVASTLETHWFWQSAVCGSSIRSPFYSMIFGGATLLHTQGMGSSEPTSSSMDVTLLKLNSAPPAGAYFAGWTTAVPPEIGSSRTGIHHPMGDWKKISYGTYGGDAACGAFDGESFVCNPGSGNFYEVNWADGGTEGGSSGSALYADTEYLIGTLTGGDGSCGGSTSFYSSFRAAYDAGDYGQWLDTESEPSSHVVAPVNYLLLHN